MPFQKYIDDIGKRYATGTAREHTYRPALQNLLEDVIPGVMASNDVAKIRYGEVEESTPIYSTIALSSPRKLVHLLS